MKIHEATEEAYKNGKWEIECRNRVKCPNCGFGRNTDTQMGWNFCPNCGESMVMDNERKTD